MAAGVSGDKKKGRGRAGSATNSDKQFGGLPDVSCDQIIRNSAQSARTISPHTFQTPSPSKYFPILFFVGVLGWGGVEWVDPY